VKFRFIGMVVAIVVVASACSSGTGSDGAEAGAGANDVSTSSTQTDTTSVGVAASGPGATVTIGTEVYDMDDGVAGCITGGGGIGLRWDDENDQITIKHSPVNDVLEIQMTIEGTDWVNEESPPEPTVIGTGQDAIVTWSGPMSSDGASERVSIKVRCG